MSATSVSSSQFPTPYKDLLPEGLVVAAQYHPHRWHLWTLFAAMAIPHAETLAPREWVCILDRIESQLADVIPDSDRHRG